MMVRFDGSHWWVSYDNGGMWLPWKHRRMLFRCPHCDSTHHLPSKSVRVDAPIKFEKGVTLQRDLRV